MTLRAPSGVLFVSGANNSPDARVQVLRSYSHWSFTGTLHIFFNLGRSRSWFGSLVPR